MDIYQELYQPLGRAVALFPDDASGLSPLDQRLLSASRELLRLLDIVNEINRLQQLELHTTCVDLREVIEETIEEFQMKAEEKDVTIRVITYSNSTVVADAERTMEIVATLLANAIEYNITAGTVTISIDNGHVTIVDTGIGMDEHTRKTVFELGDHASLYASKTLVERMGGGIGCSSIVGEGSSFWFSLPRGP